MPIVWSSLRFFLLDSHDLCVNCHILLSNCVFSVFIRLVRNLSLLQLSKYLPYAFPNSTQSFPSTSHDSPYSVPTPTTISHKFPRILFLPCQQYFAILMFIRLLFAGFGCVIVLLLSFWLLFRLGEIFRLRFGHLVLLWSVSHQTIIVLFVSILISSILSQLSTNQVPPTAVLHFPVTLPFHCLFLWSKNCMIIPCVRAFI